MTDMAVESTASPSGAESAAGVAGAESPSAAKSRADRASAVTAAGDGSTVPAADGGKSDAAADGGKTVPAADGDGTAPETDGDGTDPSAGATATAREAGGGRGGHVVRALRAPARLGARVASAARHGRAVAAVLAVATVATTALSLWLGVQVYEQRADEQRRQDILAAARRSALNFTSLDYRHYARDSANVLKGATGDFKKQFAAQTAELTKLVAANKSVSEGQVLEAGIARSDERSARVLVVADSKVTNSAAPEGQARTYRLQLDLVLEGGRWLTSNVEFVG
ncbi:hypothetical protein DDW44_25685 [Streptomyces tirandamycinicus]|uniref:Mce-associated membrane protein n=1 Tax=Streptomyces tirandamycinicus TaxID=2174846 RepID=A0A2S1SZG3_9ACTN|nr:hypothetical protein DDW44_25685 [Streptomyces tirandamycinicus]